VQTHELPGIYKKKGWNDWESARPFRTLSAPLALSWLNRMPFLFRWDFRCAEVQTVQARRITWERKMSFDFEWVLGT